MTSNPVTFLLADLGVIQSHLRPHVRNGSPYSQAQSKTRSTCPGSRPLYLDQGRASALPGVLSWYNASYLYRGLGLHTAADASHGAAAAGQASRARVLAAAFCQHPERFATGPAALALPATVGATRRGKKPSLSSSPAPAPHALSTSSGSVVRAQVAATVADGDAPR
jgi:hypothetical protein